MRLVKKSQDRVKTWIRSILKESYPHKLSSREIYLMILKNYHPNLKLVKFNLPVHRVGMYTSELFKQGLIDRADPNSSKYNFLYFHKEDIEMNKEVEE